MLNVTPHQDRSQLAPSRSEIAEARDAGTRPRFEALEQYELDPVGIAEAGLIASDHERTREIDILRTLLLQQMEDRSSRGVAVVGLRAGAGSTFTALNVAWRMARQKDRPVVLVDTDLRTRDLSERLGLGRHVGLAEYLAGETGFEEIVVRVKAIGQSLFFIPAGAASGPAELLASIRFDDFVDTVNAALPGCIALYDTHPLLAWDDTLGLLPKLEDVLVVVSAGRSQTADLSRAHNLMRRNRIMAVALNRYA